MPIKDRSSGKIPGDLSFIFEANVKANIFLEAEIQNIDFESFDIDILGDFLFLPGIEKPSLLYSYTFIPIL